MSAKSPIPLSARITVEIPKRLHHMAEAFYFAGILASAPFYGRGATPNQHHTVSRALDGITATDTNHLGAPPLVNLAFSIELYIKLLRFLADQQRMRGHNLHSLFIELESAAPNVAATVIWQHRYARGDRDVFLQYLDEAKSIFEDWRYAYEKEFLMASPDNVHSVADAFRAAMMQLHPDRMTAFHALPIPVRLLAQWAAAKPTIKTLYVFGSYARGEARPDSDLDLAFEFTDGEDALAELIVNSAVWKAELTKLTGIKVKDLYLSTDEPAQGARAEVYSKDQPA